MNTGTGTDPDVLVERYAQLVQVNARSLSAVLPAGVGPEDLQQVGMLALLEAAPRFDPGRDACFETFVGTRVRGAMLDEVRRLAWSSRRIRRQRRAAAAAAAEIEQRTGRAPAPRQIAEHLGVSTADYHRGLRESNEQQVVSLEGLLEMRPWDASAAAPGGNPENAAQRHAVRRALDGALDRLTERERVVVAMHYYQDLSFSEIAGRLGVTVSRISQLHASALPKLRSTVRARNIA